MIMARSGDWVRFFKRGSGGRGCTPINADSGVWVRLFNSGGRPGRDGFRGLHCDCVVARRWKQPAAPSRQAVEAMGIISPERLSSMDAVHRSKLRRSSALRRHSSGDVRRTAIVFAELKVAFKSDHGQQNMLPLLTPSPRAAPLQPAAPGLSPPPATRAG
jgi:hypothetical protein